MPETQKISSKNFAFKLKQRNPKWNDVPDDRLVQAFLSAHPDFKQYLFDVGPMPGDATIGPKKRTFGGTMRELAGDTVDALPAAGGMLGSILTAEGGPLTMAGGAGLGGMAGSAAKHALRPVVYPPSKGWDAEDPNDVPMDISLDALTQGGMELGSQFLTGPARSVAKKAMEPEIRGGKDFLGRDLEAQKAALKNVDVMKTNKEFGLDLTYPEQLPGTVSTEMSRTVQSAPFARNVAEAGRGKTGAKATEAITGEAEKAFGKTATTSAPNISGKVVQKDVERVSSPVFKQQVNKLKQVLNAQALNMKTDPALMQNLRQEAKDELDRITQLKTRPVDTARMGPKSQLDIAEAAPGRRKILEDIIKLKDDANVTDIIDLRSKLMSVTPETTELLSKEAPGTAKHYVQKLTELVDKSIAGTPANTAWQAFRNFTRKGSEVFESQNVLNLINHDPEKIAQSVGPKDITAALRVRRAILSYADKYGSGQQSGIAKQSWDRFRALWFQTHIAEGDILQLSDRLKQVDPRVLKTIVGTDPQGQLLIRNTARLATALDRLGTMAPVHSRTLLSLARGMGAYPLARLLYSPSKTDKLIRFSMWIARHPNTSPANATRLLQMAMGSDEPNQKTEAPQ